MVPDDRSVFAAEVLEDPTVPVKRRTALCQVVLVLVGGLSVALGAVLLVRSELKEFDHLAFAKQAPPLCKVEYRVTEPVDVSGIVDQIGGDAASVDKQIRTQVIAIRVGDVYHLSIPCNQLKRSSNP